MFSNKQTIATSVDELIDLVQRWNRSVTNAAKESEPGKSRKRGQERITMESKPRKRMKFNDPEEKTPMSTLDLLQEPKQRLAAVARMGIHQSLGVELTDKDFQNLVLNRISASATDPTSISEHGDLFLPCQTLKKHFRDKSPAEIAHALAAAIEPTMLGEFGDIFATVQPTDNGFINIYLQSEYLGRIIDAILCEGNSFVDPLPPMGERVMVEYSQPNTHKAFHVGHMRNVALGDALWRIFAHCGFDVVPANYFGDEGTHVAKCLWLLNDMIVNEGLNLDAVPETERGEFLGGKYTEAVCKLDWKAYTIYPYKNVRVAQIQQVENHPNPDAPSHLHVLTLDIGGGNTDTVICGGTDYKEGDYVPHRFATAAKDFFGVSSRGVVLAASELGVVLPPPPNAGGDEDGGKKKKKKKKKKGQKAQDKRIWILNNIVEKHRANPGDMLPDIGRLADAPPNVNETVVGYETTVQDILRSLENQEPYWVDLWMKTRQWSLDEFHKIYNWLGARFDRDFFESECSEASQHIVDEFLAKSVFVESNGCIGCDLGKKLGFCMLRKSNGAGLYATKDLFLAKKKFDEEKVDRSIYVVDAGQTLHFKQVFATLERMGYEQATKCHHEAYGQVRLPSGKMSSRTGTVQLFSSLKNELAEKIEANFLVGLREKTDWPEEELQEILHAVSVGTIRYGMLNHDTAKDVVFNLEEWLDPRGNTGPYLMYQCARVSSIQQKVPYPENAQVDYSVLNSSLERDILLNLLQFPNKVSDVIDVASRKDAKMNPSALCTYLYGIAFKFSKWYSQSENNIKDCPDPNLKATRLNFVNSIALVLRTGLRLLGIPVLNRM